MTTQFPDGGNDGDGSWFLEAVGATEPTPTGADAIADLTRENDVIEPETAPPIDAQQDAEGDVTGELPAGASDDDPVGDSAEDTPTPPREPVVHTTLTRTTQITLSSFDGEPGTTNATYAPASGPSPAGTPALPPRLPPATPAVMAGPLPGSTVADVPTESSTPDQLSRPLRTGRSFRWPIITVLVLLIAAVGGGAFWLPRATDAKAVTVRQTYYDATASVRNHLPATQGALDAVTSTQSTGAALSGSIPTIAQLDSLAHEMQRVASEALPSVLPLIPKGSIDALEPLQQQTALLGTVGTELARRLANAYIFRVTVPGLMQTGNLPSSASTETINTVSVTLAESLAADAAVVSDLPSDETFTDVRALATQTIDRYAAWQNEYLQALASEDTASATTLLNELDQLRIDLAQANAAALAEVRTELDQWIVSYAVELEDHMRDVSRG